MPKKYPSLKKELAELFEHLANHPDQGKALGNNFYKIRLAIHSEGKGKSGGARIITYVRIIHSEVYITSIYDKSEKSNITNK